MTKTKLERWLTQYAKAKKIGCNKSKNSTYYTMNHRILRVSNHVALHSDGDLSIVQDSHDTEHFLVHAVKTGEISVLTYEEVKTLIKGISLLPAIMHLANAKDETLVDCDNTETEDKTKLIQDVIRESAHDKLVCGVPLHKFKPGAQQIIRNMVKKIKNGL